MNNKVTILELQKKKVEGKKITMLTAYEAGMASILDKNGIDIILVGDSVGMVMLGYDSTIKVTMDEMIHHTKAVVKGVNNSLVIGDMPFMSFNVSKAEAIKNAGRFLKQAGCEAVKVEGGEEIYNKVKAIVEAGIPVLGHIGLTPQTVSKLGGYRVQGRDIERAKYLIRSGLALQDAGCFGIVLECIPSRLSQILTKKLDIPTIGIGAGRYCDGQVLVTQDLLGMFEKFRPKFVKQYVNLRGIINEAILKYKQEVIQGKFPSKKHEFSIPKQTLTEIKKLNENYNF